MCYSRPVTTIDDVVAAYEEAQKLEQAHQQAWHEYRSTIRAALEQKTCTKADISRRLDRHRGLLRQDAMTDEELAAARATELKRQRDVRATARAQKGGPE